jgi:hypothetical protein
MYVKLNIMDPIQLMDRVINVVSQADLFHIHYGTKLIFNVDDYEYSSGPNFYTSSAHEKKAALCQYLLTFKDGSTVLAIMTKSQWHGIRRSTIYQTTVQWIEGKGHRKFKTVR